MENGLEHLNVTVKDTHATAKMLCGLFGWEVRWEVASIHDGYSLHVGSKTSYLALYTAPKTPTPAGAKYHGCAALNHIGMIVDSLDADEQKVIARGYVPNSHQDYEPGRRFYFEDETASRLKSSHMLKPNSWACHFVCPALTHAHLAILCHIPF
jgi:hypothetical protein